MLQSNKHTYNHVIQVFGGMGDINKSNKKIKDCHKYFTLKYLMIFESVPLTMLSDLWMPGKHGTL